MRLENGVQAAACALLLVGLGLGGCASIVRGTTQKLSVNTVPQGADCVLRRDGEVIGRAAPTPAEVKISKSRKAIEITCERPGFEPTVAVVDSKFEAMTVGNIIAGGLVGVAIDAGTGAMNKYEPTVTIPLKQPGGAPTPLPDTRGKHRRPKGSPTS